MNKLDLNTDNISHEWPNRCNYWLDKYQSFLPIRKRRERENQPLILTGHGLSLKVDKARLIVKDGNTHYPNKNRELSYFKGELDRPKRIIILDGHGTITLDALDWLTEQNIPLIRIKWNGQFFSLITSGGLSADPEKFEWQLAARKDEAKQISFALPLMIDKLNNAVETLESHLPTSKARDSALRKIPAFVEQLKTGTHSQLKELTSIEAQAASAYFRAWQSIDLKWKSTKQYPIPDDWLVFKSRTSLFREGKAENVFATHPVNAMLNYVYTMLLGQMQLQAIATGFDPMLGIIHTRSRGRTGPPRPSFALDIMEPMRPVVDRVVLKLVQEETFTGADFDIQSDGVCRLNPELVRRLAQLINWSI
ncbi:CRISPR-associated endonuclease Cas1 [Hirschia litorea]|uniref:CRISPR-associated endonuclease Cas1 n=1 Tax=Hirschia litorea TaxID=1199156 RepID=A0ABW2IJ76_9PROT